MKGLLGDSRHAFRVYRRTPLASLIAVGVMAIGMAFVGSFLSMYTDLILRPHPGLGETSRIVSIALNPGSIRFGLLERMVDEVTSLEVIAGVHSTAFEVGPEREGRYVDLVTRDLFPGFRPRIALGRGFDETDHAADAAPVVIISDAYWRQQFERSPDVLGRTVRIQPRNDTSVITTVDGRPEITQEDQEGEEPVDFQIVGVMAPAMKGLLTSNVELWLPLERAVTLRYPPERIEAALPNMVVAIIGRRAPGVSAEAVANELEARYSDINEFFVRPGVRIEAIDGVVRDFDGHREVMRQLSLFLAGSLLLALVAAANVSLFLLARAPGRRRELGIRMALGAPMNRLARQLASESALLVLVSAALGLVLSVWLSNFLRGLAFLRRAEWTDVTLLDWRVLGLVGLFLALVTLAVSLAPILGLKRLGIAASSRQVAARATLAQRLAGTAQIAIAGMLGGVGIAFAWHLGSLIFAWPGYETEDIYYVDFTRSFGAAGQSLFTGNVLMSVIEQERLRETIASLPGIDDVGFGPVPGGSSGRGSRAVVDPDDPERTIVFVAGAIDSGFIDVLGFRLLHGRVPDANESEVAVVNLTAAREYFGRDNPVGEILPLGDRGLANGAAEIVGVIEDVSYSHPADRVEPVALFTVAPDANTGRGLVIRSSRPAADLQQAFQGLIDSGAIEAVSVSLGSLRELRRAWLAPDRARGLLTIASSGLVVLLAAFGFYGTQRYLVAAGRREYAVRASLGAGPRALGLLVLGRGLVLGLPGLILGGLLAFVAVLLIRDDFLSRETSAGVVTAAVLIGLTVLLLGASLGPAREARRTLPGPLLRED